MARKNGSISRNVTMTTARYRLWRSMRIARRFTIPDLMATADATRANTQTYVIGLERAGYLRVMRPRISGVKMGSVVYLIVNDSGPKPPRLGKHGVFDPNVKERAARSETPRIGESEP